MGKERGGGIRVEEDFFSYKTLFSKFNFKGLETEMDCGDIVLFWRIQQMLKVTANALRQQVRGVTQNKVFCGPSVHPLTPDFICY